ncbi:putative ion transporter superfamily protein YfcC [Cytobacillus firmus]|uniref:Putative ion transporter superfamily protein YfcC n=2 Tax=Cytobacillus TaxID=2675230 RepID=A0A366JNX1_CYTFI|nr:MULTISPECIES: putative basic amino acid antiporter YfcC [Cytobacillus]RBP88759.1 putative ion transporter superfamily protein YfcC [Cytobacillus firmus]TDX39544.1 putative ion transporter superfamily protein YfcC [Cytobacillus oceanisediminis]
MKEKNKAWKVPHTFVIVFFVVLLAAIVTYLVPVGQFQTEEVTYTQNGEESTKTVLIPNSFEIVKDEEGNPVRQGTSLFESGGEAGFLNYVFEGLVSGDKWGSAVGIVAFILIIGGAFGIIMKTRAIEEGILSVIDKTKGREILIIPIMFFLFSLGGAVFGMGEEAIAFAMILVPLMVALGYDAITGVMITYVATQIGFATSWMNPFSVAIAQGVSGVPVMSGAPFRIGMWAVFTLIGIIYTWRYAAGIKKDPLKSVSYESDSYFRKEMKTGELKVRFTLGHGLVLLTIAAGIAWIVWGVVEHAYYIPEIASQFFTIGLAAGLIAVFFKLNNMKIDDIAEGFIEGAKDLLPAALVVGMAKGIVIILGGDSPDAPSVLNTMLFGAGQVIGDFPAALSAWFMYLFQSGFNFFVVSGSGQAALTMPLMAPLADIAGVSRQVAVLAFQLGDGLTNIFVPTSAALLGALGAARLDWGTWAKFIIKFLLLLMGISSLFVIGAVLIGL